MGLILLISQDKGNNSSATVQLRFDDGMTVAAVKRIVLSFRNRLVKKEEFRFVIETSEVLSDKDAITDEPNVHVISSDPGRIFPTLQ